MLGRVRTLVRALLEDSRPAPRYGVADSGRGGAPLNLVVRAPDGTRLCLAATNSTGTTLTARLRNLRELAGKRTQFDALVILRDSRCPRPAPGTVGREHLEAIEEAGGLYLELDREDLSRLNALYDTLVRIEQQDLCVGSRPLEKREYVDYLRRSGEARDCRVLGETAEMFALLHAAINAPAKQDSPSVVTTSRPTAPSPPSPEAPVPDGPLLDDVDCSVFGPRTVSPRSPALVQVFFHSPSQGDQSLQHAREADPGAGRFATRALDLQLSRGTCLRVCLTSDLLTFDEETAETTWQGRMTSVSFVARAASGSPPGDALVTTSIHANGIPVGVIRFKMKVVSAAEATPKAAPEDLTDHPRRFTYAFLSYSSADRGEVLKRAQAIRLVGVNFFLDLLSLDPGQRWQRRLYEEIDRADLFLLFWSKAASESEWVLQELRYALDRQRGSEEGLPDVRPVVLEVPPVTALPADLEAAKALHLNDWVSYVIKAECDAAKGA